MGGIPPPSALWAMCITSRLMELWATLFAGCGKAMLTIYTHHPRDLISLSLYFLSTCNAPLFLHIAFIFFWHTFFTLPSSAFITSCCFCLSRSFMLMISFAFSHVQKLLYSALWAYCQSLSEGDIYLRVRKVLVAAVFLFPTYLFRQEQIFVLLLSVRL